MRRAETGRDGSGAWAARVALLLIAPALTASGLLAWVEPALDPLYPLGAATDLHQLRAIHGTYLALGLLGLYCLRDPLRHPELMAALATVLALAALGRSLSWALDGRPPQLGIIYLGVELLAALGLLGGLISARRTPAARPR